MEEEKKVINLQIDDILPNRFQPRIKFNEQAINELAESIKMHGVIQPIVVRKIGDKYEIIAGERRYKASIMAGKTTIPAIVTSLDDKESTEIALIENVQRQDLTPIEEAISYKKILDMGYISQQDLGNKLGKTQSTIANKLRLLNLTDEVQEALLENKISERHARSLLKLNEKNQIIMLNRIINERLTVRRTDEEISKLLSENSDNGAQKIIENEKEDMTMNNDILKDFNIPTEPIVTEQEPEELVFDNKPQEVTLEQVPTSETTVEPIQPLDRVTIEPVTPYEQQDVPVYQAPETSTVTPVQQEVPPVEPIVNPFDMTQSTVETQPVVDQTPVVNLEPGQNVQEPMQETVPTGGKFFNMFNFNAPEKDSNYVENVDDTSANIDFNIPTEPVIEPTVEAPISPESEPAINPFGMEQPSMTPMSAIELEMPVSEPQVEVQQPVVNSESVQPTIEPAISPFAQPAQPFTLNDDNDFNQVQSIPEQVHHKNFMMDNSFKFDDNGELEVKLPQQEVQAPLDMKQVINRIRECADEIESYGYKVDTDEVDLENTYEVTFRIIK